MVLFNGWFWYDCMSVGWCVVSLPCRFVMFCWFTYWWFVALRFPDFGLIVVICLACILVVLSLLWFVIICVSCLMLVVVPG